MKYQIELTEEQLEFIVILIGSRCPKDDEKLIADRKLSISSVGVRSLHRFLIDMLAA